jgi:DNA-binding PadR family transcriptional regulator
MDVKTVCLGMLTDGEASGYDLKKEFESSFSHFFAAGYGSIYPALSSLAEQGLVTCECIPQQGKPDRKVYRITVAGRQYLAKELENPSPCHKIRSEFLAMLCFSHLMKPEDVETILESRLAEIEKYKAFFADLEAEGLEEWPAGKQFVVGFGKALVNAMETYINENRDSLAVTDKRKAASA